MTDQFDANPISGRVAKNATAAMSKAICAVRGEHGLSSGGARTYAITPSMKANTVPNWCTPGIAFCQPPENDKPISSADKAASADVPQRRNRKYAANTSGIASTSTCSDHITGSIETSSSK